MQFTITTDNFLDYATKSVPMSAEEIVSFVEVLLHTFADNSELFADPTPKIGIEIVE